MAILAGVERLWSSKVYPHHHVAGSLETNNLLPLIHHGLGAVLGPGVNVWHCRRVDAHSPDLADGFPVRGDLIEVYGEMGAGGYLSFGYTCHPKWQIRGDPGEGKAPGTPAPL